MMDRTSLFGHDLEFRLCHDEFLNLNTTWYTERPQFSDCFRHTIFAWIPACAFIWTLGYEWANIRQARARHKKPLETSAFNVLRTLIVITLMVLEFTHFFTTLDITFARSTSHTPDLVGANSSQQQQITNSEPQLVIVSSLLAPLLSALTYLALTFIYLSQKRHGIHTSGPVWLYLLVKLVCMAIDYYAVITTPRQAFVGLTEMLAQYAHLPLLLLLFIFESHGDTPNHLEEDEEESEEPTHRDQLTELRPHCPEIYASFCSSVTFWWYNKFLLFGYRSRLTLTDLWRTLPRDKSGLLTPVFREAWLRTAPKVDTASGHELRKLKSKTATYHMANGNRQAHNNVVKVLFSIFWRPLLFAASLKLIQDCLQYVTPLILKRIIAFMRSSNPFWHGILFACLLLIVPTIQSMVLGYYFYRMQLIGLHVRNMLVGSVYRKSLLLSGSSRLQSTGGEIVNLMVVDSSRFQDLLLYLNLFWSAPFQIVVAIWLLYRELGWSIFAGVACMILVVPFNALIANRVKFSQLKLMKTKDERIKQINELLSGIKVIKLYAWENSFIANLFKFRNRELGFLTRIFTLDALLVFTWNTSPFIVACITFAVYANADPANILDAEKAFVSISLFNLLRFPLTMLPSLVTSVVLSLVSARRLNRFLNSDELVRYVTRNEELEAISIEGGTLTWSSPDVVGADASSKGADKKQDSNKNGSPVASSQARPILSDIELHVEAKSFVAVVGQVASGKSSLLSAVLGEMHRLAGRFNVCKSMSMAYVPQQAWIQNMTVRDNILFGSAYDETRYQQVLDACSLRSDLETLPGGDRAEIGEKGINLSGGQKQRVSLARACYSNADIYLLDDPLSALDSHVAKHVYEHVLSSKTGLLRNKTRLLATNSLFVVPHTDQVVVLDEGRVVESGPYRQLVGQSSGQLAEFMRQYSVNQRDEEQIVLEESGQEEELKKRKLEREKSAKVEASLKSVKTPATATTTTTTTQQSANELGKLTDVEQVETGSVNYRVYLSYFKAVSITWLTLTALSLIASSAFNVATNLWLSLWASDAENSERANDLDLRTIRLLVYAIFGGLQCFCVLAGSLFLCRGAVRSARSLHSNLLERVLHSPMGFFDTTPIGRIVNRFAKDIDVVDGVLPGTFRSWFTCLCQVISTIFVICFNFPKLLIMLIPLGVCYYLIQKVFIVTTRQLKRHESTTRSPIYSNFNETLSGASTIRAYNCADRFVRYSDQLVDRNVSCSYPNVVANRWLSVRLEFFGNLITASAALLSVYYRGYISAGVAGLTISYSLNITQTLSWLVRMTSDLETHIVGVERILEYTQNKQEDRWVKPESRPAGDWPQAGAIEIRQYSTRYRDNTELVLRNVSINIRPREKVGIVGRTGSGKSSLSLALFRLLEPAKGTILIDGLDLLHYGLHDIRSKLTIIPQDPVLFSGTLRFNLDPLKLYPDLEIWRALELAHLKAHISSLDLGLDHKVSEYGENFSVGQRQLICLARAILRKSKVLILDEATASVDLETDSIVQRAIREIFHDCTIITIAHRLHTILDSDRILVLDAGQVLELDSPAQLLSRPGSAFAALVRDAGVDSTKVLAERKLIQENK